MNKKGAPWSAFFYSENLPDSLDANAHQLNFNSNQSFLL